tara:strand:+ start:931 stop:1701 length:771 start_codon:yes stop_codon:yes gene_type:complete
VVKVSVNDQIQQKSMQTVASSESKLIVPPDGVSEDLPDFTTHQYKDSYSRINAIVIEGEQEANDNYVAIGSLIPDKADELKVLGRMELKHKRGFMACGKNLGVVPDMAFAKKFFEPLHNNFKKAVEEGKIATSMLIQSILIEAFAISAYHVYIRVADPFAKKITQGVVMDEYLHLNFGEKWIKQNLSKVKDELIKANKINLPIIRSMLDQVADDASVLHMDKEELMEEFMIAYQDALTAIGLDNREIARMALAAVV